MIGTGMLAALIALIAMWAARHGRVPGVSGGWRRRLLLWPVLVVPFLPLAATSTGWIFTEMGRQPWLVFGQMKTGQGVSSNSAGEVLTSLIVFTVLYGVLAVVEIGLTYKYARRGLTTPPGPPAEAGDQQPLELVY
jgi:cytochrome d ubiquinol oxidase subunit I